MNEAGRLLVETGLNIGEIADNLGFADPLYFSRKFKQTHGITASEYRKTKTPFMLEFA